VAGWVQWAGVTAAGAAAAAPVCCWYQAHGSADAAALVRLGTAAGLCLLQTAQRPIECTALGAQRFSEQHAFASSGGFASGGAITHSCSHTYYVRTLQMGRHLAAFGVLLLLLLAAVPPPSLPPPPRTLPPWCCPPAKAGALRCFIPAPGQPRDSNYSARATDKLHLLCCGACFVWCSAGVHSSLCR